MIQNLNIEANIITILLTIFSAGLLSGLSPCSLPTVALIIGYVNGDSKRTKFRGFVLSLFFVLGIAATLSILGIFASALGSIFSKLKIFSYIIGFLLILMGLWMLKIFDINSSGLIQKISPKKGSGIVGAFLLGLLFGIAASPCTTPITLSVLALSAAKGSMFYGVIFMFIYAIGRSVPILLAGTFTGLLKNTKFLDKYQSIFEKIGGVALIGIGLFVIITI